MTSLRQGSDAELLVSGLHDGAGQDNPPGLVHSRSVHARPLQEHKGRHPSPHCAHSTQARNYTLTSQPWVSSQVLLMALVYAVTLLMSFWSRELKDKHLVFQNFGKPQLSPKCQTLNPGAMGFWNHHGYDAATKLTLIESHHSVLIKEVVSRNAERESLSVFITFNLLSGQAGHCTMKSRNNSAIWHNPHALE